MSEFVDHIIVGLGLEPTRTIQLKRPMRRFAADNLRNRYHRMVALNEAGLTMPDAAAALGISLSTIRNWADNVSLDWKNLKRYKPRRRKA